ncbi:MAG: FAD-dependent oxidoreductase [Ruminococcaceae bacterium]|nr:FAD-dependent oxidoreductase [Oscillospiraceae bacterium]
MKQIKKDIVVIGGGPGGLAAAVTAARQGASVLLVERLGYLGGQLGSGLPLLGFLDKKRRCIIGGFAQEFVDRMQAVGGSYGHEYCPHHLSTTLLDPFYARILAFEMVKEAGAEILLHCELSDVKKENGKIVAVTVTGKGQSVELLADIFVDGTGDADLAFMAGAECMKGNEDGMLQPPTLMFNLGGVDIDRFADFLTEHPEQLPHAVIPNIEEGYDAEFIRNTKSAIFLGLNPLIEKLRLEGSCPVQRDTVIFIKQPIPGHVAINTIRLLNFDGSDLSDLSQGEMDAHLQIPALIKMFKDYVPGFENCYLTFINSVIGVRESRRVMGHKLLTLEDAVKGYKPADTIGLCNYFVDVHNGAGQGTIRVEIEEPFGIPYGALVSKDIENLMITGRPISVDHMTFGATRIMNVCMAVGQAVGDAAAMAVKGGVSPIHVDIVALRETLLAQKAILDTKDL